MLWFAHSRHRESDETSAYETQGSVINWGWRYDLMVWYFDTVMFHGQLQELRFQVADLAQLQRGETVLDVGCGTGTQALVAKERVGETGRVCGVDRGPKQIAYARSKAARRGLPIDFQVGVIEQLPFSDQVFEVVLSTFMMHHLPDDLKRRGLAEIARVLKPGGRLVVLDMKGPVRPWKSRLADQPALMKGAGFSQIETGDTRFQRLGFVRARKSSS